MKVEDIKKICVVGAGNMGHQISLNAAIQGYKTVCVDVSQEALAKAQAFTDKYLPERVVKGKMSQAVAEAARKNISFITNLAEAVKDAGFVIEAATEKLELKRNLFAVMDKNAPSHAILATNSSFIASSKVVDATSRPEKVLNMHYFNPALVMKVVEVVKGPHTSEETVQVTMDLCRRLDKTPVLITKEIYGFVVNRILMAINDEALYLAEHGIASVEDIDAAVVGALNHPMGPFKLMDLTGLDLYYYIKQGRFEETGKPEDTPVPLLEQKFKAGEYGQKTRKGFYNYK
ncbi:MAG: putative 3-hydroxybutyryl-CoA dehydrogenase [Smithella sp. PtaU1.Bin162]|nr:MAG: putative 3-hydroxybutyryl-CoA dehydrogenase [Smithella sp. PtaU1.Bin162]